MIEQVYVAAYRKDFSFTRLCVASIRYWYPEIPIILIKDLHAGDFDTSDLERNWQVQLFPSPVKNFSGGFSKLEPLFLEKKTRYLMLDSDLVMTGPVLDSLGDTKADFVISPEVPPEDGDNWFYDLALLKSFDPDFAQPKFYFNTGQYVATSGLLRREDFDRLLEWSEPRKLLRPDIFKCGDQGIFNYQIFKGRAEGRFSMGCRLFYRWGFGKMPLFRCPMLRRRTSPPLILHWAGVKYQANFDDFSHLPHADVLQFFHEYYLSRSGLEKEGVSSPPAKTGPSHG